MQKVFFDRKFQSFSGWLSWRFYLNAKDMMISKKIATECIPLCFFVVY